MGIDLAYFGTTAAGKTVDAITLQAGDLSVTVLTYGAIVQSVRVAGVAHDLTLGSTKLRDYEGEMCFYGALIGPVVNRLTNAEAPLGDAVLHFDKNFAGKHVLHSGPTGSQHQVWQVKSASQTELTLTLALPDGLGGFPGNRRIETTYEVSAPASLRMTIRCVSDVDTIFNASNHSYWNMDGSDTLAGHQLRILAEDYLPTNADVIPTGEVRSVAGPMDFRSFAPIAAHAPDLDNSFVLGHEQVPLRDVLWLKGTSGLMLTIATTEAAVQVYDCRHDVFRALAIEPHGWPDAPNKPNFPSIALRAGETRRQITEWRFSQTA